MRSLKVFLLVVTFPAISVVLAGCHAPVLPTPAHEAAVAQVQAELDSQREQLARIPPPSKNRFMIIRSFESWENPYITVQPEMLELHVTEADPNPSTVGAGGMFRPVGARREELNLQPDKLAEAVSSIPEGAWPYGRVIALEEAHKTPKSREPQVRRQMEMTISKLNDLGIEVYDPIEGNLR